MLRKPNIFTCYLLPCWIFYHLYVEPLLKQLTHSWSKYSDLVVVVKILSFISCSFLFHLVFRSFLFNTHEYLASHTLEPSYIWLSNYYIFVDMRYKNITIFHCINKSNYFFIVGGIHVCNPSIVVCITLDEHNLSFRWFHDQIC